VILKYDVETQPFPQMSQKNNGFAAFFVGKAFGFLKEGSGKVEKPSPLTFNDEATAAKPQNLTRTVIFILSSLTRFPTLSTLTVAQVVVLHPQIIAVQ